MKSGVFSDDIAVAASPLPELRPLLFTHRVRHDRRIRQTLTRNVAIEFLQPSDERSMQRLGPEAAQELVGYLGRYSSHAGKLSLELGPRFSATIERLKRPRHRESSANGFVLLADLFEGLVGSLRQLEGDLRIALQRELGAEHTCEPMI